MKKILVLLLSCALFFSACTQNVSISSADTVSNDVVAIQSQNVGNEVFSNVESSSNGQSSSASMDEVAEDKEIVFVESGTDVDVTQFENLSDPALIQYIEDGIYAEIEASLPVDQFVIEDVSAIYISKEYLAELEYNSRTNIYFGYTLDEVESQMNGQKYIFTLGDDGTTVVQPFEDYDDTFDQIVRNVAIGTGVILICVTVSVVSGGVGAPAVAMVFAASAKTATTCAVNYALVGGVVSAAITGIQTGDMEEALKAGALSASEGYAMGAIVGSVTGGVSEFLYLRNAAQATETAEVIYEGGEVPKPRQSELDVLEKYGGDEQMTFLNGQEVPWGTQNATRPDVVRFVDGRLEAIEVKNYNLASYNSRQGLYRTLSEQVASRCQNLPEGSLQRIVLDVRGRDFSLELIEEVITNIQASCTSYPNIPVDILY